METYIEMKNRHQAEVDALPLAFAFSRDQYRDQLEKLGVSEEAANNGAIIGLGGGGFIRSCDKDLVIGTFERIHDEEQAAIAADTTGDGFIYQMFLCELNNHEFSYTGDIHETLDALSITEEDINSNKALQNGLRKAVKKIIGVPDPSDE